MSKSLPSQMTRRQVLELLGIGAAAALPHNVFGQTPTFPRGSIIRTVLKDYQPEELAGGATLFHEHMQLATDFNAKFAAAAAAVRAANGLPPVPARGGGGAGRGAAATTGPDLMHDVDRMSAEVAKAKADGNIACIVDAGHPDMGRDVNFLRQVSMKSGVPIVVGGGFYSQPFYPKEIATMSEEQIVKALIKQADDDILGAFGEIGHLGNLVDANVYVHKTICRRGAFIGFDRQGNNDAQQVPMVTALIEAGFADHLVFSSDASSGYAKTLTVFLPKLNAAGVTDEVLRRIMVDNPRRFLAFVPKRARRK